MQVMATSPPIRHGAFFRGIVRLSRRTVLGLVASVLFAAAALAADPFYMQLLRQGTDAYNRHDYQTAARQLRIACFGLLDEPTLLADGLTRLALAQAAAGDNDGFRETFQRLTEVQARFSAYTQADIPKEVRTALEQLVVQLIPPATLAENPAFSYLVPNRWDSVAKLPPSQQRKELERLIKAEPTDSRWRLMLAELELSQGRPHAAYTAAEGAMTLAPGNREALRLRGLALAGEKKWPQAAADLQACGTASSDPRVAGALLSALVELKRWQEAGALTAQLSPAVANDPAVRQLTGTVAGHVRVTSAAVVPTPTRPLPLETSVAEKPKAGAVLASGTGASSPPQPSPTRPIERPTTIATTSKTLVANHPSSPATNATERHSSTTGSVASTSQRRPADASLSSDETAELRRVQDLVRANRLIDAFTLAQKVADANPGLTEPQHLAAEMAYRISRWREAAKYFKRGGDPGDKQPLLLFYEAVSFYEVGDRAGAAAALKRCLPNIRRTPYVEEYAGKIFGSASPLAQKP
jgi:tetratricopeptide (TPR) repeat protein